MKTIQIFKPFTYSVALTLALLLSGAAAAQVKMLDRVIAVVNNIAVTETELQGRLNEVKTRSQASGVLLPDEDVLKKQIIDQLIVESLQMDLAKRFDVIVSDDEVNQAIENVAKNNKMTEQQFFEQLQREGTPFSEFRENIRKQLTIRTITEGIVSRRIRISDKEVDNFLQSADARFWAQPDYRLGHILVALPSSPSNEKVQEAQTKANDIFNRLKDGANFANTAIAESNGQMALQGGDLGWRKPSALPTLFADTLNKLEPGDVSKPMRSQAGFHIVKIYEVRGEQKRMVKQNRSRHILLKNSEILDDEQARAKLNGLRDRILNGEGFDTLAKEYSEDIGTRLSGGELGWASVGQFVPAFEKTIEETPIMEISLPFKSRFGWHILQVLERRDEDMTAQALRAKARNIILGRRFEDETQIWIQELRDDAYIDLKI